MIFIAGISIALFISALIFAKKNKSKSDIFLFLWMILNAIHLTFFYLLYSGSIFDYPNLLGLQFPLPLLHGVILYYYVSSVTNQLPKSKISAFTHLIPTLLTLLYLIPFILLPSEQKIEIFKNEGKEYEIFQKVLLIAVFLSGIVYVIWSSLILRKHKKRIRNQFSNIEEINLKWLQFLTYGLGVVWSLVILTQNDNLIFIAVSIFVMLVGFFGIQQKNIFSATEIEYEIIKIQKTVEIDDSLEKIAIENEASKEKYTSSGLSEEKADKYYEQLNNIMVREKIFTDSELSLSNLASKLEIHPNYLSQIINEKENKTFYDYINTYRVEEFKKLIAIPENQKFTLMTLAYDCGFNSKSSFNRYFKKITALTPSQYIKVSKN